MQTHAPGSGQLRPMGARRQAGVPAARLGGMVVLQESSFSKPFARTRSLSEAAQHPTRDGSPVIGRETHLSGPGRKIAPAGPGMSDGERESSEQVWCSSRVRSVMLVKGHNLLVTRPSGSC